MSEDMTYCMNKDCKKKKCERHASHIKDKTIPHSYAMYDCSAEKSRKWAISRPKNGISLNGREYVCDEGKVGVIMIPWEIITGAGLLIGTAVGYLIAAFATILAGVLIAADEKRSKERERAERYRQRFQHEASREY